MKKENNSMESSHKITLRFKAAHTTVFSVFLNYSFINKLDQVIVSDWSPFTHRLNDLETYYYYNRY